MSLKWFDSFRISPWMAVNGVPGMDVYDNPTQTVSVGTEKICHNYELEVDDECTDNLDQISFKTLYMRVDLFDVPEVEEIIIESENGRGETRRIIHEQRRWLNLPYLASEYHLATMFGYQAFNQFTLTNINTGEEIEIDRLEVRPGSVVKDNISAGILRVRIKDPALTVTDTCGSVYENAPFEGCESDGQGSGGGSEGECVSYTLSGSQADTVLSVSTTSPPPTGVETFRWRYRVNDQSSWQLLSNDTNSYDMTDNYGEYQVVAFKGGCQTDPYIFNVPDTCEDFTVDLNLDGNGYLVANTSKAATLVWEVDTGSGYIEVSGASGNVYFPEVNGTYHVIATSLTECEVTSDPVVVNVANCDYDVSVVENLDGSLTVDYDNYSGVDTPSFRWEKETASGIVPFGGTTDTVMPDEPGIYHGYVELDGCEMSVYKLVLSDCIYFKAYIESIVPSTSFYTLYAGTINAPGAVEINWYQYLSGSYVLIGTGNSVTTSQVGHVKMVATSGNCEKVDYSQVAIDFDNPWYAQRFDLTGGEDHVEVTEFLLPDIDNLHPDRIMWLMDVDENGVAQAYDHETAPVALDRMSYSIDGQDVRFNPAYSRAGTILIVKMRKV